LNKITSISKRHNLPLFRAVIYELFVRTYQIALIRKIFKVFIPARQPSGFVFVLGCYNSGTTVVKSGIGLHPRIAMAPVEGDLLTDVLKGHEEGGWSRCMAANCYAIMDERINGDIPSERIVSDWRPWIQPNKLFLEKSISNTIRIPLLRRAFPGSRFVFVVRQPFGVISGIKRRSRPGGFAEKLLGADVYPDELLLRQWVFFHRIVLRDFSAKSDDICFCSYEKFIDQPAVELHKIYNFVGLDEVPLVCQDDRISVGDKILAIHGGSKMRGKEDYLDNETAIQAVINRVCQSVDVSPCRPS